jgi:hypothetical protein
MLFEFCIRVSFIQSLHGGLFDQKHPYFFSFSHNRLRFLVASHCMTLFLFALALPSITAIPLYNYNPMHVASAL